MLLEDVFVEYEGLDVCSCAYGDGDDLACQANLHLVPVLSANAKRVDHTYLSLGRFGRALAALSASVEAIPEVRSVMWWVCKWRRVKVTSNTARR